MGYLEKIEQPADLRNLELGKMPEVCKELRTFIVDNAAKNGGHFGSSLGVVELTVALHYVFDTPKDQIVWDVGHQAYGHKILTGRRKIFHTNRTKDGISGFTKQSESPYDSFVSGHASISISAALGMATASKLKGEDRKHIAVIGDGAMTGGEAFEGLNNAAVAGADILVILNDNQISIDPNVGAITKVLVNLGTSKGFNAIRRQIKKALSKGGKVGRSLDHFAMKLEQSLKNLIFKNSNFFESLGFRYFGPVDGHDVKTLSKTLEALKTVKGPKILHILTTKGKGFAPAEAEQTKWHATGGFDKIEPNKASVSECKILKYQEIFGKTLVEIAKKNKTVVGITPAMPTGSSLNIMMEEIPERAFDVGIAEQHAVTFAAGMATQGMTPFCNIYSTFAQRAYDQIIHDVCIEKTPVVFCLDRAGLVGEDGETHQGAFDIAYLRPIPNLILSAPMNEVDLRNLMYTASEYKAGPMVIRYPRGKGVIADWESPLEKIEIGRGREISKGKDMAILSFGHPGNFVEEAIKNLSDNSDANPSHYNFLFVKPLDKELLHKICKEYAKIITIEDGSKIGGFGAAILEFMNQNNYKNKLEILGIPDEMIKHATVEEQRDYCGIGVRNIINVIRSI